MATNTYVALATQTLGTATNQVIFSSIPGTYTDLKIVVNGSFASEDYIVMQLNGDTSTNYSETQLRGNGSSAASGGAGNRVFTALESLGAGANERFIIQANIMNYANTTTYKTILTRSDNASRDTSATVSLWRKTPEAVTSIRLYGLVGYNFNVGSTFSLYGIASEEASAKATGGMVTSDSTYWYHTFTSTAAFVPKQSLSCDVLVISGGGGGGSLGGGGGAGGLKSVSSSLTTTSYTVTVGGGGAGTPFSTNGATVHASSGVASSFATILSTTAGGGAGTYNNDAPTAGYNGGSGGGGGAKTNGTGGAGGTGVSGEGSAGGVGNIFSGGGGGGAGSAGSNGGNNIGGNGGTGTNSYSSWASATSTGDSGYYASGGGGACWDGTAGTASSGGGTAGKRLKVDASNAMANTGGGGGSGGFDNTGGNGWGAGGNGGSGVVIVRYLKA